MSDIKVGDRVRNIDPKWAATVPVGSEGTVVAVGGHYPLTVEWDSLIGKRGNPYLHLEEEVEAVK